MKKKLKSTEVARLLLTVWAIALAACSPPAGRDAAGSSNAAVYTCPMHPQIRELHPGNCPICGMPLVKKSGQASQSAGISLNSVLKPVSSVVISDVALIRPQERAEHPVIYADGYLDFDSRTFNDIAARFTGRIEKLYIKFAFQPIHRGERIMDIYSPEIVAAEEDLLLLSKAGTPDQELVRAAKDRLLLLGMTAREIGAVINRGKPVYSLPVYSPYEGHVHDVLHPMTFSQGEATDEKTYSGNLPLSIKDGMYVQKGQVLFNVADSHRLWAVFKIAPRDMDLVRLNERVQITFPAVPGRVLNGRVNFIEPLLEQGDKGESIRVYLQNMDHQLKVNSLARAAIETAAINGLWVPRSAVLQLGMRTVVWVKQGPVLRVRAVTTGATSGNDILIHTGISVTDSIAANAQYLSDSESLIHISEDEQTK